MRNIFEAMCFLILETVAGVGMFCLWNAIVLQIKPSETPEDFKYRKLGYRSWCLKFLSIAVVGCAAAYWFQLLAGLEIVCLGFGAFYLAMSLIEYFHCEDNFMAGLKLVVPIMLFLNAYETNVWFIIISLLIIVYDVQKNRADQNVKILNKKTYEESDKK